MTRLERKHNLHSQKACKCLREGCSIDGLSLGNLKNTHRSHHFNFVTRPHNGKEWWLLNWVWPELHVACDVFEIETLHWTGCSEIQRWLMWSRTSKSIIRARHVHDCNKSDQTLLDVKCLNLVEEFHINQFLGRFCSIQFPCWILNWDGAVRVRPSRGVRFTSGGIITQVRKHQKL